MRVLFVTNGFPPSEIGGTEVLARNVGRHFLENGDEVTVFAPAYSHEQQNDSLVEGMRIHRVPPPSVPSGRGYSSTYVDGAVDLRFASFLLEAKPEVAIVWHTINLSARILEALGRMGVPYILFLSDFHFLCNQTHLLTAAKEPCDGPEVGTKCKECIAATVHEYADHEWGDPAQLGRLRVSTMRRLLGFANSIVAPSEFVKEKYVEFGLDAEKISVISPGVDVKSIKSKFKPVASGRLRFGYFGGNSELRGISDVLEAFLSIKDPSIELVLAGQRINEIPPEQLPANTRIIGRYLPEDVGRLLSEIDVLVVPSRCHESYNLVEREAAACGIPIIVSDLRAQSDALQDGVSGLCFKAGDPADLAAKVLLLKNDMELLQTFKRQTAGVRSVEQTAAELRKLCKDLVGTERVTSGEMGRRFSSFLNDGVDRMEEERRMAVGRVNDELTQARTELLAIQGSFSYRLIKFLASRIDRLLPEGTRIGEFRKVVSTSLRIITGRGIRVFLWQAWEKIGRREFRILGPVRLGLPEHVFYDAWLVENVPNPSVVRKLSRGFQYKPKFSIVMLVHNADPKFLREAIDSVVMQLYENWELCICDNGSTRPEVKMILLEASRSDKRIRLTTLPDEGGIADGTNAALSLVEGEFTGFLGHEDKLYSDALFEVVKLLNQDHELNYMYSDGDKIDPNGRRVEPSFKPDWSPDLLLSVNYVTHFSVYRTNLLRSLRGLRDGYEGSQQYDLVLRATEKTTRIGHVRKVIYGQRISPTSTGGPETARSNANGSAVAALQEAMIRRGIKAQVETLPIHRYHVKYEIEGKPLVTIIIPARTIQYIAGCVRSIIGKTSYDNYEVLVLDRTEMDLPKILDPSEKLRFIVDSSDFNFSRINNQAAKSARGDYLVFLNDDTEVISGEWLSAMLEHAQREDVGVVGAKLLRANGTVQHAGIIVGIQGASNYGGMTASDPGYLARASVIRNCTAVTGACMMVRKRYFMEMGGFDEALGHSWNDVDFGIRVVESGHWVVYTPFALLYHYVGGTRGEFDESSAERRAKRIFSKKNSEFLRCGDPFYNPNLSTYVAYLYLPKCSPHLLSDPQVLTCQSESM